MVEGNDIKVKEMLCRKQKGCLHGNLKYRRKNKDIMSVGVVPERVMSAKTEMTQEAVTCQ